MGIALILAGIGLALLSIVAALTEIRDELKKLNNGVVEQRSGDN